MASDEIYDDLWRQSADMSALQEWQCDCSPKPEGANRLHLRHMRQGFCPNQIKQKKQGSLSLGYPLSRELMQSSMLAVVDVSVLRYGESFSNHCHQSVPVCFIDFLLRANAEKVVPSLSKFDESLVVDEEDFHVHSLLSLRQYSR